jgi:ACS family tartrate transporter-like MFS transporter
MADTVQATVSFERNTIKKVRNRLIPFLIILYFFAMLDRVNIGYAALTMNKELGITAAQYGMVAGIFFIGYFLFEVPSNLIMTKFGTRRWIGRILITWGFASAACGMIQDATHLYIGRFTLGVMEAGFFPGIMLYLTYWFPAKDRAKVVALFMLALPISSIVGSPISGLILDHVHWLGISSWRWLFYFEGIPTVILGILTIFFLPDKPHDAKWLTDQEKTWLEGEIQREHAGIASKHKQSIWSALTGVTTWLLAIVYFSKTMAVYGVGFFAPTLLKGLKAGLSNFEVGLLNAIPYIFAAIFMIWWSNHSDRTGERRWHVAISVLVCAVGLIGLGFAKNAILAVVFLTIVYCGSYSIYGSFWAMTGMVFTGKSAAVAMAAINSIANLGGFIGPVGIGALKTATGGGNYAGFYAIATLLFISAGITLSLKFAKKDNIVPVASRQL